MSAKFQYRAICHVCGLKRYNWELRKRWDGLMVCGDTCWETRNILDFYRPRGDVHTLPWTSPEPTDTVVGNGGFALNCVNSQNATLASPAAGNIVGSMPYTIEAMVLLPRTTLSTANIYRWGGGGAIFRFEATDSLRLYYTITASTNTHLFSTGNNFIPSGAKGRWARLGITIGATVADGIFYIIYRDSTGTVQMSTIAASNSVFGNLTYTGGLIVGNTTGFSEPAPGPIDDIRIWNVERTSAQMLANWDTIVPATSTGLVSNFRFDDLQTNPPSTTTADSVISQSLTINGASAFPHLMGQGT